MVAIMLPTRSIKSLFLRKKNKLFAPGAEGAPGKIKKRKRKLQAASAKLRPQLRGIKNYES